jgi:hypothetical protein
MFLLYYSEGCNICGGLFHKCYINDLHTTTCSGMLGHRTLRHPSSAFRRRRSSGGGDAASQERERESEREEHLQEGGSRPEIREVTGTVLQI